MHPWVNFSSDRCLTLSAWFFPRENTRLCPPRKSPVNSGLFLYLRIGTPIKVRFWDVCKATVAFLISPALLHSRAFRADYCLYDNKDTHMPAFIPVLNRVIIAALVMTPLRPRLVNSINKNNNSWKMKPNRFLPRRKQCPRATIRWSNF